MESIDEKTRVQIEMLPKINPFGKLDLESKLLVQVASGGLGFRICGQSQRAGRSRWIWEEESREQSTSTHRTHRHLLRQVGPFLNSAQSRAQGVELIAWSLVQVPWKESRFAFRLASDGGHQVHAQKMAVQGLGTQAERHVSLCFLSDFLPGTSSNQRVMDQGLKPCWNTWKEEPCCTKILFTILVMTCWYCVSGTNHHMSAQLCTSLAHLSLNYIRQSVQKVYIQWCWINREPVQARWHVASQCGTCEELQRLPSSPRKLDRKSQAIWGEDVWTFEVFNSSCWFQENR